MEVAAELEPAKSALQADALTTRFQVRTAIEAALYSEHAAVRWRLVVVDELLEFKPSCGQGSVRR